MKQCNALLIAIFLISNIICKTNYLTTTCLYANAELSSGRIKGDDEPRLLTWRVLEGVTEHFGASQHYEIPAWKAMKEAADQKAASMMIQQALREYGQLLRHPQMFGDMPMAERYDIFISMAKLLKMMGFIQRSELLLYESMAYSNQPYEAHFQLGLLYLDREDIEKAKVHFKNCLFFRETDLLVMVHLSVILLAEGRNHEAKFFISRALIELERRLIKLASITRSKPPDLSTLTVQVDHLTLSRWLDDVMVRVFHDEYRITPSSSMDMIRMFSNLYSWLDRGEVTGRFIFDLGQSLYEGGKPRVGSIMMLRGYKTSDSIAEGMVSTEIVKLRLSLDFPLVPTSITEIISSYINMTQFLSETSDSYNVIELDNIMDMYWPLPLLYWSGLPMNPVINELLWRFYPSDSTLSSDHPSRLWLQNPLGLHDSPMHRDMLGHTYSVYTNAHSSIVETEIPPVQEPHIIRRKDGNSSSSSSSSNQQVVEIGILAGHMNNHPVGQMVLQRILSIRSSSLLRDKSSKFRITLIALPLKPDYVTKHIATLVDAICNLPIDATAALELVEKLQMDVMLFPDWQPFPDQQSLLFQSHRLAPVQVCFFVRGSSCSSAEIDYYILPSELSSYYLNAVPASSINSTVASHIALIDDVGGSSGSGSGSSGRVTKIRQPWLEMFSEQVVLLDWPLLNSHVIHKVTQIALFDDASNTNRKQQSSNGNHGSKATSQKDDIDIDVKYLSHEIEGPIFFDNQPVAIIPIYPSHIHPLMDEILIKILRSVPSLQLVFALSDYFFSHATDTRHKMSWGRKLVNRLIDKSDDSIGNRIRLLPITFQDYRLLKLFRQADMILDSFPIGMSFHFHALALSTGTPIITLRTGTIVSNSKNTNLEVRRYIHDIGRSFKENQIFQSLYRGEIKWNPSISSIASFYDRIGLSTYVVANSTSEYIQLATTIASNREISYDIRIKILEAVDESYGDSGDDGIHDIHSEGECLDDLASFLYRVGLPYTYSRVERAAAIHHPYSNDHMRKDRATGPTSSASYTY